MAYTQYRSPFGDTTYTKVFVGGLAWETQTEEMRKYFEQFGDILEAVIITDKNTGRSKGYGFVTFRDPESAKKACIDPNPVIDGRKANCNIASFGRPRSSPPQGRNQGGTLYRGVVSMGNATSYNRAAGPQMTSSPSPPQPALSLPQVVYPPYGYTTYAPDYGYTQTMYSPQLQAQYYHQMYGAAAAAASAGTSTCSTGMSGMGMGMGMASPYYYGFALPSATAAPPSLTFSAHRQSQNMAGPSYFPLPSATATATATSTITTHEDTSLITFPPPALSNSTPSLPSSTTTTISDSRTAQEQNSATAETGVVGSEVEEGREQG